MRESQRLAQVSGAAIEAELAEVAWRDSRLRFD
jgi:hypothetical protein